MHDVVEVVDRQAPVGARFASDAGAEGVVGDGVLLVAAFSRKEVGAIDQKEETGRGTAEEDVRSVEVEGAVGDSGA